MSNRYEINHLGQIVLGERALVKDIDSILNDLFSQYNWKCSIQHVQGSKRSVELENPNGEKKSITVYVGTIRDEKRNPYEKKIQLGIVNDLNNAYKTKTIILGVYVYNENDDISDAIFVGYPIDDNKRYETNPSLRRTFVNKILIKAKNEGFVYDKDTNYAAFRAEFINYYLSNFYQLHYEHNDGNKENESTSCENSFQEANPDQIIGENLLIYGVPGCGKSSYINKNFNINDKNMQRVIFYPDYSYSDFIGQILPRILVDKKTGEKILDYSFTPGPFTNALKEAKQTDDPYYLIIEEINRGNAAAIFGDIFQLLDRNNKGESQYGISNQDIAASVYGDSKHLVKIPHNLYILATMNTSDQNVFPLDTAFQRRWKMKYIHNEISDSVYANSMIEGTKLNWISFATVVNETITNSIDIYGISFDKCLGSYFAQSEDFKVNQFPQKVLKYLWDDAFKMQHDLLFKEEIKSIDSMFQIIEKSNDDYLERVLKDEVYERMEYYMLDLDNNEK